jgi:hypothetical protein
MLQLSKQLTNSLKHNHLRFKKSWNRFGLMSMLIEKIPSMVNKGMIIETLRMEARMETLHMEVRIETLRIEVRIETLRMEARMEILRMEVRIETLRMEARIETLRMEARMETLRVEVSVETLNMVDNNVRFVPNDLFSNSTIICFNYNFKK